MKVRDPDAGHAGAADQGVTAAGAGVTDGDAPRAGCTALMTGASSGVDAATALPLARQGAAVAVAARRTGRLEDLAAVIHDRVGSCRVLTAALGDAAQARRAIEDAVDRCTRSATPAGRSPPPEQVGRRCLRQVRDHPWRAAERWAGYRGRRPGRHLRDHSAPARRSRRDHGPPHGPGTPDRRPTRDAP
ncbi:SDR family NAD(P)-dependent oxidoreductase [Streptomyces filipinensis]|uniref:SDR family NAD(P)-dependent oxidoreductase n=1 Tax=Streptomyces filipinensis TaxID=66887 RepID=UPI00177D0F65|nr:SDR family NAD(P)-dependent oxidoreductase [Streptomyces filipinensis]